MLKEQKLVLDHDKNGTIHLFNTYDVSKEAEIAKKAALESNGTTKVGNDGLEVMPMGYIPPDMWLFDPWLKEADRARVSGDMGEFTKYMKKFFEIHPMFKAPYRKRYF